MIASPASPLAARSPAAVPAPGRRMRLAVTALSFAMPLAVYAGSMSASPGAWDTGEMQTAAYVLGIPHPTGFPLFILIGFIFSHIVPFGTVAWRMNFLCGVCIAGSSAAVCMTALRLGAAPLAALAGTLCFAFGSIVWNKGSHTDVHSMTLLWMTLAQLGAVAFVTGREAKAFERAGWFAGLGLATHPIAVWTLPAIAFAGVAERKRLPLRAVAWCCAGIVAPLACYLYFPLRSILIAAYNLDPTAALAGADSLVWDSNHPRFLGGFINEVTGAQYSAASTLLAVFSFDRYAQDLAYWFPFARNELGVGMLILAPIGLFGLVRRNFTAAATLLLFGFASLPFTVAFNDADVARYFLLTFSSLAILASLSSRVRVPRAPFFGSACLLGLGLCTWSLVQTNAGLLNARNDRGGQALIDAARADVPATPAVIIAGWIDATTLAYGRNVEGAFPGSAIVAWNSDDAQRKIANWRQRYRIFFIDDWTTGSLFQAFPASWLTELPPRPGIYRLFEICRDPAVCRANASPPAS